MANFFGKSSKKTSATQATTLRVQTSIEGKALAIGWGQARLAGNLLWYGDFISYNKGKGGKGGATGGKGSGATVLYTASAQFALCAGPVQGVLQAWDGKTTKTLAALNLTAYLGASSQTPWGYLTSRHPDKALAYRGISYVAAGPFFLGSSAELPNLGYEVKFAIADAIPGLPDADPAAVVFDFLTNDSYGVGLDPAFIGDLSVYSAYCRASGLVISPILTDHASAQDIMGGWLEATNSRAVWSGGVLNIVPYGDQALNANGAVYTPPAGPVYYFTDDDFTPDDGAPPVEINRSGVATQKNAVKVEYLDRTGSYNPAVAEAKDDAAIQTFGLRASDLKSWHFICNATAAKAAAELALGREAKRNRYTFTVGREFILADPGDIVAITDTLLGLFEHWVRIDEIKGTADGKLVMTCEEYLLGTGTAPDFAGQTRSGYAADYNVDPGMINPPLLFETTDQYAGGLAVFGAVSGVDHAKWGGCDVWATFGGDNYELVGRIEGPARMGVLSSGLPTAPRNLTGQTIDTTGVLSVDLSESAGELVSGLQGDALAGNTVCYVGGELLAYQTATLTGANDYDLTYLVRGLYGSEAKIASHPAGTPFVRLDQGVIKIPFDQSRIGSTLLLKFVSFNVWGGGDQQLSDVDAVSYVITGEALASPLPQVMKMRTAFVAGVTNVTWDEIDDFRPIFYEVRKGDTWASALTLNVVAHPPFACHGDGTYWVAAVSQPTAGLKVYSETPSSIIVTGSLLTSNVLAVWNEKTTGWLGTCTGGAGSDGTLIRTGGQANILADPDILANADIINAGGQGSGTYEIPASHIVDAGRVTPCPVNVTWRGAGVPVGQDILAVDDILSMPDILGSASSRFVEIYPEIAVATDTVEDFFAPADTFAAADVFNSGGRSPSFGEWQKYVPGVYVGRWFKARLVLKTNDPDTMAVALDFEFTVDVPDRIDHFPALPVPAGGAVVEFRPNGSATPAAFNGGPNGSAVPYINVTILDGQPGDFLAVTGTTLASANIQILNGGLGVARTLNVDAQGY